MIAAEVAALEVRRAVKIQPDAKVSNASLWACVRSKAVDPNSAFVVRNNAPRDCEALLP